MIEKKEEDRIKIEELIHELQRNYVKFTIFKISQIVLRLISLLIDHLFLSL